MLESIVDFSFLIIAIAFAGFLIKNLFYVYRKWTIPYDIKGNTDQLFSYISLTICVFAIIWTIIYIAIPDGQNVLSTIVGANTAISLAALSVLYLFVVVIAMILGVISRYVDQDAIQITFIDNSDTRPTVYKRIITESNDFFYLESMDNFRYWSSIRKEEIKQIERFFSKSQFNNLVIKVIKNHNRLNFLQNERLIFSLLLVLFIILLALVISSNIITSTYIQIAIVIVFVPLIFLMVVGTSLKMDKQ